MTPEHFHHLLKNASGLDVASVGESTVGRAVLERQQACAMPDLPAYWNHVQASATEIQALIEEIVVPETWFFRDAQAFAALARFAGTDWDRASSDSVLRLLSFPCSTGEEPYSMSMALLGAGVPARKFRIDAMDISERALDRARGAVYGKNSFRGSEFPHQARYFKATATGRRLDDAVCAQVNFQQGNVLAPASLPCPASYDVIFCRNLLIYFDRATQDRAIGALSQALTADGLLFVGPAEAGLLLHNGFTPACGPMAFGFRKPAAAANTNAPRRRAPHAMRTTAPRGPAAVIATTTSVAAAPPAGLDLGKALANLGRFVEAAVCCEAHIKEQGPSADAFHILGLVRDACGNAAEADVFYRKALYLDPCHEETLVHLALLLETQNKGAEAQRMRKRARRLVALAAEGA